MSLIQFLKRNRRSHASRRSARRPQSRHSLWFEALEDRSLLSTFTVANLGDSGDGSLRAAVLAAEANPGADVVEFAKQVQGTITLTTGELLISTDLSIEGPGADRITVSGNDASRVFHVVGGNNKNHAIDVSISGLTVAGGRADFGAGIYHECFAGLTLTGMTISNNRANTSGGGLQSFGRGAELSLTSSTVADNQVIGTSASVVSGGGIRVEEATAQISDSSITGNQVIGRPDGGIAIGGGIDGRSEASVSITSSTISNNRAVGGTGGGEAVGGGVANRFGSTLHVSHSILSGNDARGTDGPYIGQAIGGAISNGFGGVAYISDSELSGNRAVAGSGGLNDADDTSVGTAFGGAIVGDIYLEVTRSTLVGNEAIGGNNATHIAPTTTDVGSAHGGAILISLGGEAIIRDSAILNNKAIGGSGNTGSGPVGFVGTATGGGIDNSLDPAVFGERSAPPMLTVINTALVGNEAIGGNDNTGSGGQVFASAGLGGGIANYLGGITNVSGSHLRANKATGGNGGLGAGGGIFNGISVVPLDRRPILVPSIANVSSSTLALNLTHGGQGSPGGNGLGGGAYNDANSTLSFQDTNVVLNRAIGAPSSGEGIGGGIYNLGDFAFDTLTIILNNHASTSNDNIFG